MSFLSMLGFDPRTQRTVGENGVPMYSSQGNGLTGFLTTIQQAAAQQAAQAAPKQQTQGAPPREAQQVDTSKVPPQMRQASFGQAQQQAAQAAPVSNMDGSAVASMVNNSLTHRLSDRLDQDSARRSLQGINQSLAGSYGEGNGPQAREAYRAQAQALDPNSLQNGGSRLIDYGGIQVNSGGKRSGFGSAGGGNMLLGPRTSRYDPIQRAQRESAARKDAKFAAELRDEYGTGRDDRQLRALQLREQELRNKQILAQIQGDRYDRNSDAEFKRKQQLLQLLDIAGGLRY